MLVNNDTKHRLRAGLQGFTRVVGQVQYSLLDRRPENGMAQFCQERGIKLLPYGVVGGGLLSDKYLDMPAPQYAIGTWPCVHQPLCICCAGPSHGLDHIHIRSLAITIIVGLPFGSHMPPHHQTWSV
jgi:hypothetical protein